MLFRPDESLTKLRTIAMTGRARDPIPGTPPPVGVGPGGGLTTRTATTSGYAVSDRTECEKDRMDLAMADNERMFREPVRRSQSRQRQLLSDRSARAARRSTRRSGRIRRCRSTPIARSLGRGSESLQHAGAEHRRHRALNSNDLTRQIRRVADDLTSYYLIGYYSTNSKLDGRFRNIKVRSKRPGIEVRARRGYSAATAGGSGEGARASASVAVPGDEGGDEPRARARSRATRARQGRKTRARRRRAAHVPSRSVDGQPGAAGRPAACSRAASAIRMEIEADAGDAGVDAASCSIATARRPSCRSPPASAPTRRPASAGWSPTSPSRRSAPATTWSSSRR